MSHSEALNGGFSIMLTGSSLLTSLFLPAEIPVILLILAYSFAIYALGLMIGNSHGQFDNALSFFFKLIVATIFIFAIIYWRYGLIQNGELTKISIFEGLYFSVTTWTTLGYGDFAPPSRIRHITSIQAIMGYIGLGIWISLISGLMNNLSQMRQKINKHNDKLFSKKDNSFSENDED